MFFQIGMIVSIVLILSSFAYWEHLTVIAKL